MKTRFYIADSWNGEGYSDSEFHALGTILRTEAQSKFREKVNAFIEEKKAFGDRMMVEWPTEDHACITIFGFDDSEDHQNFELVSVSDPTIVGLAMWTDAYQLLQLDRQQLDQFVNELCSGADDEDEVSDLQEAQKNDQPGRLGNIHGEDGHWVLHRVGDEPEPKEAEAADDNALWNGIHDVLIRNGIGIGATHLANDLYKYLLTQAEDVEGMFNPDDDYDGTSWNNAVRIPYKSF